MKKVYTLLLLMLATTITFAQVEGTWQVAPQAGSLGVGPELGDLSWWSNDEGSLTLRDCFFDDRFVFAEDGTFSNVMGDESWIEGWQSGTDEACGGLVAPHDGSNAATWTYDEAEGTITVTGTGAHLGLAKVINGGELSTPADAPESITYNVSIVGDVMDVNIDFGAGYWHYILARDVTSSVIEQDLTLFTLFPNPANEIIQINSEENIDQVIVRDVTGKRLIVKSNFVNNETIDVSSLSKGLFLVECRSGNVMSTKKLIKL